MLHTTYKVKSSSEVTKTVLYLLFNLARCHEYIESSVFYL